MKIQMENILEIGLLEVSWNMFTPEIDSLLNKK